MQPMKAKKMITVDMQYASKHRVPTEQAFQKWVEAGLSTIESAAGIVVRIVDEAEIATLNERYRRLAKPTNILSFPFVAPMQIESNHLGDLVICAPVVVREAKEQKKQEAAHWAHMVIHGCLHLLGYDHMAPGDAREMELLETELLISLGYADPYDS